MPANALACSGAKRTPPSGSNAVRHVVSRGITHQQPLRPRYHLTNMNALPFSAVVIIFLTGLISGQITHLACQRDGNPLPAYLVHISALN